MCACLHTASEHQFCFFSASGVCMDTVVDQTINTCRRYDGTVSGEEFDVHFEINREAYTLWKKTLAHIGRNMRPYT